MFGNGHLSMTHPDEVFYMQSTLEMIKHNKWFTPMIFDHIQFEKPFLCFALFKLGILLFGFSDSVARLVPALFAMIGVGVVYWISWMLFQSKRAAFLAGLVLASSFIYLALARSVLTDMIFSVLVTISIGFFYLAYSNPKRLKLGLYGCAFFAALAVLAKGLLGVVFPATTALLFLIYKKDLKFFFNIHILGAIVLFLVISLPWHIVMYQKYGDFFLYEYFGNVHIRRLFEAEHRRLDNLYFYPFLMFIGVMPWSFFWVPTFKYIFDQFKKKTAECSPIFFLFAWMLTVYAYMQPASSKLSSYIFPLYPAIAILLSKYLDQSIEQAQAGKTPSGLKICAYLQIVLLAGVIIAGNIFGRIYLHMIKSITPVTIASIFVAMLCVFLFVFNVKKQYFKLLISNAFITAGVLVMVFFAIPHVEEWVSCKKICEIFKTIDNSDTPILSSKFYVRGVRFYTQRDTAVIDINGKGFWSLHPIPFLNVDYMVRDFFKERPMTYAIVKEGNVLDIERIIRNYPFKLEKLAGVGGKYILRITNE